MSEFSLKEYVCRVLHKASFAADDRCSHLPIQLLLFQDEHQRWFVEEMVADAAGYAGTEIIRRIVGSAKVKDITTLTDTARLRAERTAVLAAKTMILTMQRPGMDPKEYTEALRAAAKLD